MLPLTALLLVLQGEPFPGTRPLEETRDLADLMMDGLHRHVERKIDESHARRVERWKTGAEGRRDRLRKIIGAVDPRLPARLERFGDDAHPALVAETPRYRVWQVRWPVLEGVTGEGLLLEPAEKAKAACLVLPEADDSPEEICGLRPGGRRPEFQFARRLAEVGVRVLVPVLIDRSFEFSGREGVAWTNQSHREWITRQAFHMGRHVIGYEVQKALAAADLLAGTGKLGILGVGEGGLVALMAAALEPRFDAALVIAYFSPREVAWQEPLYRTVWSLLREFGDAELGAMVAPRPLGILPGRWFEVTNPDKPPASRRPGAAVGELRGTSLLEGSIEVDRLAALLRDAPQSHVLIRAGDPLVRFVDWLGVPEPAVGLTAPSDSRRAFDPRERQRRQVRELEGHVQGLLQNAARTRAAALLNTTSLMKGLESRGTRFRMAAVATRPPEVFAAEMERHRARFWEEVLGKLDEPLPAPNARSRKVYDRPSWSGWDVTLDGAPEFFAWGLLLVPKDIAPGERRPVVVCQHGRNGLPKETVEGDHWAYHDFAAKLAEKGYVVFSPHNPYRGEDKYRLLNRKANLLGTTLFSYILHQHRQILAWLKSLPMVDGAKIGFYGLSYGGETAVRVPPILTDYALSICSGDFNDWARKVASVDNDYSFMYSIEWEMPYFDLGSTFNYAEMAYLMVPRPFMVERGHHDGVAPDEWVAAEYSKVRWLYSQLGLADRTAIDFQNGGHTIYGKGTFDFLKRHLGR
jgi:dienelactone hydrolase